MAFKKGTSGNPSGRPKGRKNEKTEYIRQWVIQIISTNAKELLKDFQLLSLEQQWRVIATLLPYAIPKQAEAKVSASMDFSQLTEEQIDRMAEQMAQIINTEGDSND
jgi:hypothetical protein